MKKTLCSIGPWRSQGTARAISKKRKQPNGKEWKSSRRKGKEEEKVHSRLRSRTRKKGMYCRVIKGRDYEGMRRKGRACQGEEKN